MAYTMEYAESVNPTDEIVEDKGVKILIDPKAVLFLLGTEMDYKTDKLSAQFVFNNPNQTSACGCGESVQLTPARRRSSAGALDAALDFNLRILQARNTSLDVTPSPRPNAGSGDGIVLGIAAFRTRLRCAAALCFACALTPGIAAAQSVPKPGSSTNACKVVIDDDDDDAKPVPGWKRFAWEEACVEISGELTAIYQKQKASASRIPLISSRQGTVTNASELTTFNPSIDINTTRQDRFGRAENDLQRRVQQDDNRRE